MAFASYSNIGPFTNNALPSISSTFLNNIESFLDQIDSNIVIDTNISSDGAGNVVAVSLKGVLKSLGGGHTLTDWNFGAVSATTGGATVTHGLKNAAGAATGPNVVFVCPDTTAGTVTATAGTVTTTTFKVYSSLSVTCWWLALLA